MLISAATAMFFFGTLVISFEIDRIYCRWSLARTFEMDKSKDPHIRSSTPGIVSTGLRLGGGHF